MFTKELEGFCPFAVLIESKRQRMQIHGELSSSNLFIENLMQTRSEQIGLYITIDHDLINVGLTAINRFC